MEAAYYLTRLLLPRQLDFVSKRLEEYKQIAEKIKANDLEYLETRLKHDRRCFEDYFSGLNEVDSFKDTGDKKFNLSLDGKQVPEYHCPNCNDAVEEFNYGEYESCPNCGGEHMLFRIGADYD